MLRVGRCLLLALSLLWSGAAPAPAQVGRAAVGGALGVVGGAAVTLAAIVGRARFEGAYLDAPEDLIHWQAAPMIAAPAAGIVFGMAGDEALAGSILGSTAGVVVGAAVGAGLGWALSRDQEWPWAGGVIGGGIGLALGGLLGGVSAWSRDEDPGLDFPAGFRFDLSVPVR